MSASTQSIKRKLSLLALAEELQNVSRACRIMGYHCDSFYEIRRAFQVGGLAALVDKKRGSRGPHPNRICPKSKNGFSSTPSISRRMALRGSRTNCGFWASMSVPAVSEASGSATTSRRATGVFCGWRR